MNGLIVITFSEQFAEHCAVPDSSPLRIGEALLHTVQIVHGVEAVDICFVVSSASTLANSLLWLQMAVPVLNGELVNVGVGAGDSGNRYCLVRFGSQVQTQFLSVEDEIFFPYNQFVHARRKFRRTGNTADGYEAIEFTVLNAPFRKNANVSRMIVLVTDTERTSLLPTNDLTRETVLQMLHSHSIQLDTIVSINVELQAENGEIVLGYHDSEKVSLLQPNGGYEIVSNQSVALQATGNTISDYVALSQTSEGSSWPLGVLDNQDYHILLSFANVFIDVHNLLGLSVKEICESCQCIEGPELVCTELPSMEDSRCHTRTRTTTDCEVSQ